MHDKKGFAVVVVVIIVIVILGATQFFEVRKAHSSFDDYYAFRGCVQLLQKTDIYGICKTKSGAITEIVEINNKWYLKGDGPGVW